MGRLLGLLALGLVLLVGRPGRAMDILSPTANGVVLGHQLKVVVRCSSTPELDLRLDGARKAVEWHRLAQGDRWLAELHLEGRGHHELRLDGRCGLWRVGQERRFTNVTQPVAVADAVIERFFHIHHLDGLAWNWGEAVFLYGLAKFAPHSVRERQYVDALARYHQRHAERGLGRIQWADECPAALSALLLHRQYGREAGWANLEQVIAYLESAPRNALGSLDHLGQDNLLAFFVPGSIWVDSLMMWALLAVEYGLEHDVALADFGLDQPHIFADVLQDRDTGLFYHAWHLAAGRTLPQNNTFWLRGNGWVLVALVEMLAAIGPDHPRYPPLARLFVDLAAALEPFRQRSGYWDTVVAEPGFAYEESSGTALVAYAWAKGTRLGLLPDRFRALARDSLQAIVSRLRRRPPGWTMEEISRGTNPSSRWGYRLVLTDRNISYGVGALLLLVNELAGDDFL